MFNMVIDYSYWRTMTVYKNNLPVMFLVIISAIALIFPLIQIHGTADVEWKIFKEKNGLLQLNILFLLFS